MDMGNSGVLTFILEFILSSTLGIAAKCLYESLIGCSNLPYHPFFVLSFPLKPKLLLLRIKYLSTFRWNCRPFWSHSTYSLILTQGFEGETRHFVSNKKGFLKKSMKERGKEPTKGRNDYMRIKCNNSLITSFFLIISQRTPQNM